MQPQDAPTKPDREDSFHPLVGRSLKERTLQCSSTMRGCPVPFLSPCLAAGLLGVLLSGCGGGGESRGTTIQVRGSDTMVNVAQAWAEEYRKVDPTVYVEVSGGGSGVGIAALDKGTIDIANASRDMKAEEIEQARKNTGKEPKEFIVGYDALAVYVHKDNPIDEISIEQLAEIFGEKRHRDQVVRARRHDSRGSRRHHRRVSRQSSSGTYEFFREHVLETGDFKLGSRDMNGSKEVVELVGNTPTAIGYSGMGYAMPSVKMLRLPPQGGRAGRRADRREHPQQDLPARPLAPHLHPRRANGAVKGYIDWILSEAGQEILEENGYVPVLRAVNPNCEPGNAASDLGEPGSHR